MIPKIIHWGLFGERKLTALNERCMESWRKVLPDWEIVPWTDANGPAADFFHAAPPINRSNYIKYWALAQRGGVFLDNDVELLQPFDTAPGAFVGFQRDDTRQDSINTAVIGAHPGHPWIAECLDWMDRGRPAAWPVWWGCGLPTQTLFARGLRGLNDEQMLGDIQVYSKDRFYPWRWDEKPAPERIGPRTIAVHWWEGSWK